MKRLQKTDFINKLLASTVGADVDTTGFPVWEVSATNSHPLRGKDGTIFEKAVIKPNTLFQLAALINREAAPLMQDHNMEGSPKGKFFYGEAMPDGMGGHELRGFMYADPTEYELAAKIDNGTVDEVSVAFAAERMTCSECGWDYAKAIEQDDIMPVLMRTCENGHVIGKNGVHLELEGVRDMLELSVVSRGAAKNSKIIGQSDSKLSKQVEQLAAHGLSINDRYVTASASKGFENMDLDNLVIQLTDAKAKASKLEDEAERLRREHAEAVGARNEAETKARELEQKLAEAERAAADAPSAEEREAAKEDRTAKESAIEFLKGQYVAVMTAAGEADPKAPDTVDELLAGIKSKHTELSAILPIGGVTYSAKSEDESESKVDLSVYKTANHGSKR